MSLDPDQLAVPGIVWPAIPSRRASTLLGMVFALERSQWWAAEKLLEAQLGQLASLLAHAVDTVPFYERRLKGQRPDPAAELTASRWRELPLLTRDDVVAHAGALRSRSIPNGHGRLRERISSGSTGRRVRISSTGIASMMWHAITMRDHSWQSRDPAGRLCVMRSGRDADDPERVREQDSWGPPMSWVVATGPGTRLYHQLPVERQARVIASSDPDYLLLYPSAALGLAEYCRRHRLALPRLRQVRTYAEPLTQDVRDACWRQWKAPVTDIYSAEEVGYIALQCPAGEHYHVQSEATLVEVLGDDGEPCRPGEIGRVVVTPLHNFAMPLLRYEIGDYARVGAPCHCGRGLPVLERIMGRARNRALLADGRRIWPELSAARWRDIVPASQLQIAQSAPDHLEVRLEMDRAPEPRECRALGEMMRDVFEQDFELTFVHCERLARRPNGKLERFVCLLDDE